MVDDGAKLKVKLQKGFCVKMKALVTHNHTTSFVHLQLMMPRTNRILLSQVNKSDK